MKLMMADGKEVSTVAEAPTYIVASSPERDNEGKKGSISKKNVLFAVTAVLIVAITLVAILVGLHMFSQAQKDIVKFSLQFKGSDQNDIKQEVESDPNDNVVMYHLNKAGQDSYVVNDFNKGIQVVKMSISNGMNCYVSALNRTNAMDPGHITGSSSVSDDGRNSADESFLVSRDPISDRSFLTKKAADMCKGVSVYWVTRHCPQKIADNTTVSADRSKRAVYAMPKYNYLFGVGGCCKAVWACGTYVVEYVVGTRHYCQFYYETGTCCTPSAVYPEGVPYPYCQSVYALHWATPGLIC